jgi:hypothetical protein
MAQSRHIFTIWIKGALQFRARAASSTTGIAQEIVSATTSASDKQRFRAKETTTKESHWVG